MTPKIKGLILQRKVELGKLQNLVHHLIRTAFWIRICKPSGDFQSKIGANPSDSYPIFAEISLLPSFPLIALSAGQNSLNWHFLLYTLRCNISTYFKNTMSL